MEKTEFTARAIDTVFGASRLAYRSGFGDQAIEGFEDTPSINKGWYAEGIGYGLVLRDPAGEQPDLRDFLNDFGGIIPLGSYIGIGLALYQKGADITPLLPILDPFYTPTVFDGYGFNAAVTTRASVADLLDPPEYVQNDEGYLHNYYAGTGRALWFSQVSEPNAIAEILAGFPEEHGSKLWAGVALGATYAGGTSERLEALLELCADAHEPGLRFGCGYANWARGSRQDAEHGPRAVEILIGRDATELYQAFEKARIEVLASDTSPSDHWISWKRAASHILSDGPR